MEHADYLHLVRVSEIDAEDNPKAYRRHVMLFASLGYAYTVVSVLASTALWVLAAFAWNEGHTMSCAALGVAGVSLAWLTLRNMVRPAPDVAGVNISPAEAPELFRLLEKIRTKVDGPRIHRVVVTRDYNAFIQQTPRFGAFGPSRNTLGLGLPLMLSLSPRRLVAVLAHEYAHLRSCSGQTGTWLYRSRRNWARLAEPLPSAPIGKRSVVAAVTHGFVDWYAPRFAAKTFALARQEEFDADALSARICGPQHTAAALIEVRVKADHMTRGLWRNYWRQAILLDQPPLRPFAWACSGQHAAADTQQLERCMARLRTEPASHSDTHPSTRDRVHALGQSLQLPLPSAKRSTRILGHGLAKAIAEFDGHWWSQNESRWTEAHRCGQRDLAKIGELKSRLKTLTSYELMRLGELIARLGTDGQALAAFKAVLRKDPHHGKARWRVALEACERNDASALTELRVLATDHPDFALAATEEALALLDRLSPDDAHRVQRQSWKELKQKYLELENAANEASHATPWMMGLKAHDLNIDELSDLVDSARFQPNINRLWVSLQPVPSFPQRRVFVVFVEQIIASKQRPADLSGVQQRLDLPGKVLAVPSTWLNTSEALKIKPPVGEPVYINSNHLD